MQNARGAIPVHLAELSPDNCHGTFPGFVYQLGNLIASVNAILQAEIAAHFGEDYAIGAADKGEQNRPRRRWLERVMGPSCPFAIGVFATAWLVCVLPRSIDPDAMP